MRVYKIKSKLGVHWVIARSFAFALTTWARNTGGDIHDRPCVVRSYK